MKFDMQVYHLAYLQELFLPVNNYKHGNHAKLWVCARCVWRTRK